MKERGYDLLNSASVSPRQALTPSLSFSKWAQCHQAVWTTCRFYDYIRKIYVQNEWMERRHFINEMISWSPFLRLVVVWDPFHKPNRAKPTSTQTASPAVPRKWQKRRILPDALFCESSQWWTKVLVATKPQRRQGPWLKVSRRVSLFGQRRKQAKPVTHFYGSV